MVDEPFSLNSGISDVTNSDKDSLLTRYYPEKASGPSYLIENLNGKCFSFLANNYKYEFCPFNNVTQREQSYRWNSFHGILGVWKEWIINGDNFTSMLMVHGDVCAGSLERETKVNFTCGKENEIISVNEPSMCKYEMKFKTPYACPKDVFLVYPILSNQGKIRWIEIENEYAMNVTTKQGYMKRRLELLVDEKIYVDGDLKQRNINTKVVKDIHTVEMQPAGLKGNYNYGFEGYNDRFATKQQCDKAYTTLLKEVEALRSQLTNITLLNMESMLTASRTTVAPVNSNTEFYFSLDAMKRKDTAEIKSDKKISKSETLSPLRNKAPHAAITTNDKVSKEFMNKKKFVKKLKSGQRGDDGTLDENIYPMRNLLGRLEYDTNLVSRLKIHGRKRDQGRQDKHIVSDM